MPTSIDLLPPHSLFSCLSPTLSPLSLASSSQEPRDRSSYARQADAGRSGWVGASEQDKRHRRQVSPRRADAGSSGLGFGGWAFGARVEGQRAAASVLSVLGAVVASACLRTRTRAPALCVGWSASSRVFACGRPISFASSP